MYVCMYVCMHVCMCESIYVCALFPLISSILFLQASAVRCGQHLCSNSGQGRGLHRHLVLHGMVCYDGSDWSDCPSDLSIAGVPGLGASEPPLPLRQTARGGLCRGSTSKQVRSPLFGT